MKYILCLIASLACCTEARLVVNFMEDRQAARSGPIRDQVQRRSTNKLGDEADDEDTLEILRSIKNH